MSRGFVYVRESEDLMEEARQVVTDAVEDCLNHQRNADWSKIKISDSRYNERIYLEKNKTSSDDFADYYGCIK